MIKENLAAFLQEQGAKLAKHSGRTLYDHLIGTYELLEKWGNTQDVCDAGLFHSIYGTKQFRKQSWPISDRKTIQALIGERAEFLVYLFCVVDRPQAIVNYDGVRFRVTEETLAALREIEAANLIEQNARPRWLKELFKTDISPAAKQAIDDYLRGSRGFSGLPSRGRVVVALTVQGDVDVALTVQGDVDVALTVNGERVLIGDDE